MLKRANTVLLLSKVKSNQLYDQSGCLKTRKNVMRKELWTKKKGSMIKKEPGQKGLLQKLKREVRVKK